MKPSDALVIALVLTLIAVFPAWPHSKDWGYRPSAVVSLILIVFLIYLVAQTV
jgi:Protein of unknown function (DUF3309)